LSRMNLFLRYDEHCCGTFAQQAFKGGDTASVCITTPLSHICHLPLPKLLPTAGAACHTRLTARTAAAASATLLYKQGRSRFNRNNIGRPSRLPFRLSSFAQPLLVFARTQRIAWRTSRGSSSRICKTNGPLAPTTYRVRVLETPSIRCALALGRVSADVRAHRADETDVARPGRAVQGC